MEEQQSRLISAMADLAEEDVLAEVKKRLRTGEDPLKLVIECQQGMRRVGERYDQGQYYIAGLIMAGEILRQVTVLVEPLLSDCRVTTQTPGLILLGTVRNDIHDLGKNIVKMLLVCHGFTVRDLGVDVSPETFVTEAARIGPDLIGLSGLITAAYDSMRETVDKIEEASVNWAKKPYLIIGGSQIDRQVADHVGVIHWANKADAGVKLCRELLAPS